MIQLFFVPSSDILPSNEDKTHNPHLVSCHRASFRPGETNLAEFVPVNKRLDSGEPLSTDLLEQIERIPTPPAAHHPLNPFPKSVDRGFSERHPVRPLVVGDRIWQNSLLTLCAPKE